jgi:squalene-hopene/tetraprenyl-beta-curcumene cyclase
MSLPDPSRLEAAYQIARTALLAERTPDGHWVGELSTSALSTATAVSALALVRRHAPSEPRHNDLIDGGLAWLAAHQNSDGGWGDTDRSFSNISTTMLCRAAFPIAGAAERYPETLRRAATYMTERFGQTVEEHAEAVRRRYGKDRTFSVPILMTSALAGLVQWREVPSLPFELACFPQSLFRFLRLPVVSYALPALIAIGQSVYHHRPPWNPVTRLARRFAIEKSLRVLQAIQPSSGGYLEATPLTSFVTIGLASIDRANHPVARHAVKFLVESVRTDGSWPIDTNLATWVTTLSINALAAADDLDSLDRREAVRDWLLKQQYRERHPFTGAAPGAWAWTDLPGGAPDADDTPGAILALTHLSNDDDTTKQAISRGAEWLAILQNGDGGWPTFCRGWTNLPFDRSGADLTAHTLRTRVISAGQRDRGLRYLAKVQRPDGSWLPLWFGNQHAPDDESPTYGTARVLAAYRDLALMACEPARRGVAWLFSAQNADGGWGAGLNTPSSIEETALAVEVLLGEDDAKRQAGVMRGLTWLINAVEKDGLHQPTPIGFYFAKLWYYEKLYPMIFTVAALGRARRLLKSV